MAKANTGTTVKKVLLRIKRYWFFLILSILMAAVTVASSLYVPILIRSRNRYCNYGTVPVDYEYLQQQNYVSCDKGYP